MAVVRAQPALAGGRPRLELCEFLPAGDDDAGRVLAALAREHQLDRSDCVSVIGDGDFSLLLVDAPTVEASELKAAVRWRIKDLIDYPVDEAVIEIFDVPDRIAGGRAKMIYVVAAPKMAVRRHIDRLEGAGIALAAIDIPELVQRNVAALLPEDPDGVAFLRLDEEAGLLTLTRGGELYLSRKLEIGIRALAAELPEPAPASAAGHDELTLELPTELAGLPNALQRQLDAVVLEVQRSLDYYESHFGLPPVTGLVLAPTSVPIPGMIGHFSAHLGIPVRALDLNAVLESASPLSDTEQARCLEAIGAALRHSGEAR